MWVVLLNLNNCKRLGISRCVAVVSSVVQCKFTAVHSRCFTCLDFSVFFDSILYVLQCPLSLSVREAVGTTEGTKGDIWSFGQFRQDAQTSNRWKRKNPDHSLWNNAYHEDHCWYVERYTMGQTQHHFGMAACHWAIWKIYQKQFLLISRVKIIFFKSVNEIPELHQTDAGDQLIWEHGVDVLYSNICQWLKKLELIYIYLYRFWILLSHSTACKLLTIPSLRFSLMFGLLIWLVVFAVNFDRVFIFVFLRCTAIWSHLEHRDLRVVFWRRELIAHLM